MRQLEPTYLGVLKTDKKASDGWIMTVWRLPSGHTQFRAMKATEVAKNDKDGTRLMQVRLVDTEGNPV